MNSFTTSQNLLVAIDIAKKAHDILISWPTGKAKSFKVPCCKKEFQRVTDFLLAQGLPVIAAFEPTADYHRTIAHWLIENGIEVHLVSSVSAARVREAIFNSWDKHDRKDAKVILYMLSNGLTQRYYDPLLNGHMHLQEISNTFYQVSRARTRCHHSLVNHGLPLFFPEFEKFINSNRSKWFCSFLLQFPTANSILQLSRSDFVNQAWDIVGRKVSKERLLNEIYETAKESIALPVPHGDLGIEAFKLQIRRYLHHTETLEQLEQLAEQAVGANPDYICLRSIPGVGPILGLTILAETGDFRRFKHHRQYLKFCGFNLCSSQSGNTKGRYSISKRGNARLRYAFWLAATVAIRQCENSFRRKYEKYISADPINAHLKRRAYTAVAVKMARVAHSIVKRGKMYRGYYEVGISSDRT